MTTSNAQQPSIDAALVRMAHTIQPRNKTCPTCGNPPCPTHHARALASVTETWIERAAVREYEGGMARGLAESRALVDTANLLGLAST